MRAVRQTTRFKRDLKREAQGQHRASLEADLLPVLENLVRDIPLMPRYRDHALSGNWKDHRNCHIRQDLLLIYSKPNDDVLQLVRLGSHGELGL